MCFGETIQTAHGGRNGKMHKISLLLFLEQPYNWLWNLWSNFYVPFSEWACLFQDCFNQVACLKKKTNLKGLERWLRG